MKTRIARSVGLFTAAALLFFVSGCGIEISPSTTERIKQEETSPVETTAMLSFDLQTVAELVELPEYVEFVVTDGEISYPAQASSVTYEPLDFTARAEEIAALLSDGQAQQDSIGDWTFQEDGRTATISVGSGGISYYTSYAGHLDSSSLVEIIDYSSSIENSIDSQVSDILRSYYTSDGQLSDFPLEDAQETVTAIFHSLGIQNAEIIRSYAMDADTMNSRLEADLTAARDIYDSQEDFENSYGNLLDLSFTQADECYMFILELMPEDGDTLTGLSTTSMGTVEGIQLYCAYGRSGLIDLECKYAPDIEAGSVLESGAVISPAEAAQIYVSDYAKFRERQVTLTDISFVYCIVRDMESDQLVSVTPVWLFKTNYEKTLGYTATYYDYIAVNAITGELM